MMHPVRWLLIAAALVLAQPLRAAAPAVSPEPFFKHPDYSELLLSPSGKYLGALVPVKGRKTLAILSLENKSAKVIASVEGQDVGFFDWINDDRLVFSLIDLQSGAREQRGGGGLYAIDREGGEFREIAPAASKAAYSGAVVYHPTLLLAVLRDGSDDVLVESNTFSEQYFDVYRVNTRTGRRTLKSFDKPGNVVQWVADRAGAVRACETYDRDTGESRWYWRASEDAKWIEQGRYAMRGARVTPVAFDGDGSLIVLSDIDRPTEALYRYDPDKRAPGELLVAHPTHDLHDPLVFDRVKKRIVGVFYDAERPGYAWFDEDWARIAGGVDKALPAHMNLLQRGGDRVLVFSYSDTDPGQYYLLDLKSNALQPVVAVRSGIKPEAMPHREAVRYPARDGLSIPAYLTLPKDTPAQKLPLVVEVHGGPWVRGNHWGWEPQSAYFASLGYAVLQPEFRGSLGWGRKSYEASWKQWGRAMQDDLDDGVEWLVQRGIVDPARVCIMGASYGGYAVMMGLARNPERWKCGIDWVGVTDPTFLFDVTWSDTWRGDWTRFGAKQLIGDPDKDADLLKAVSPLQNAARIKSPVLMAYGAQDVRVPLIHGERMRDALRRQGVPVEWIVYNEEAHGWLIEANNYDFYTRVANFLDAQIGPGAATRTNAGK